MEYVILFLILIGCVFLIWYISRKTSLKTNETDLESVRKAAEHGDVFAQYALAVRYQEGGGVPRDMKEAVTWYRKAAAHGHVEAQFTLASLLDKGDGIPRDRDEAYQWYTKAALQGHQAAQNILAAEKWRDVTEKKHATRAHPAPQGATTEVPPETIEKIRLQAEEGDMDAQYNLGIVYYNGEGVPRDHAEALSWFLKAAEQGDADAQFNVGLMYGRGEGIKRDQRLSMEWFQKAAEQGHSEAQEIISKLVQK